MARKYTIDQDAFSDIKTESAAYCLGFILADGYRASTGRGVCIDIKPSDEPVLHYIKSHCGSSAPIFRRVRNQGYAAGKEAVGVRLMSVKLTSDLEKLGVIKNKSAGTSLPSIDPELTRHMLRGYFDGNGTIGERQLWLASCLSIVQNFIRIGLDHNVQFSHAPVGKIYRLSGGRKSKAFLDWMYGDCEFALPRKLETYNRFWRS